MEVYMNKKDTEEILIRLENITCHFDSKILDNDSLNLLAVSEETDRFKNCLTMLLETGTIDKNNI
jgi:hypothetical protein